MTELDVVSLLVVFFPPSSCRAISSLLIVVSGPVLSLGSPLVQAGRCRSLQGSPRGVLLASSFAGSRQWFAMPASCCPHRSSLRWYESSLSLDRGRVVGPDLSSVRVVVGAGRRVVGVVDGWWCV
jgi:hypothetical protein